MRGFRIFIAAALLLAAQAVSAQSCTPPGAFHHTNAIRGAVTLVPGSGTDCDIQASITAGNDWTGGAFAWYTLPQPVATWRISFRMDLSEFTSPDSLIDSFHFLSASTRHPHPPSDGTGHLLNVGLVGGGSGGSFYLAMSAACNGLCTGTFPLDLADGDLLRFEVATGAGDGHVRFWLNAPFTDPPSGALDNLDNAAWQGVDMVALGVFESSAMVAAGGGSVTFSDIESLDDSIFWSNFDP